MSEAIELMLTGMGTVFFILIMVVLLGNLIIRITNKFAIDPVAHTNDLKDNKTEIEPSKLAALISAVEVVSGGKGHVTSIQKLKN